MAEYVVVDKEQLEADLTTVADSIREKSGTTEDLAFPLGMKEVVESIDTSKPEQEKTISITENGTTEVTPDEGKVLSKVTVNVEVASGGGSSEEFVGIKYSDFDSYRGSPRVADARSLPDETANSISKNGGYTCLFANGGANPNNGWHGVLEEVFVPKLIAFGQSIFSNCAKLKNIYGDFSDITTISNNAFDYCKSLPQIPYLPSLTSIGNYSFRQCIGLTSVNIYNKLDSCHSNAFMNCTNIKDIYVPWSEGEVANAPWGATNATIHYNTTYDENQNPIV